MLHLPRLYREQQESVESRECAAVATESNVPFTDSIDARPLHSASWTSVHPPHRQRRPIRFVLETKDRDHSVESSKFSTEITTLASTATNDC